jgi:hypothetical protein
MTRILFDSSIHLGQFCISDETLRLACKNSQASISAKPENEIVGVVSFNENSWSDHIIWSLERDVQDVFYKFMDVFHSVKNIDRIELLPSDAKLALEIAENLGIDISNALSCAIAVGHQVDEIHTFYPSLMTPQSKGWMAKHYGIAISLPTAHQERKFSEQDLEQYYQDTLLTFRQTATNLIEQLHT